MSIAIHCPKCNRTIGDTDEAIKVTINCKNCGPQKINLITIADHSDYVRTTDEKGNQ